MYGLKTLLYTGKKKNGYYSQTDRNVSFGVTVTRHLSDILRQLSGLKESCFSFSAEHSLTLK